MTTDEQVSPVIGLDLMGGDLAPGACVEACATALDQGMRVAAFGTAEAVEAVQKRVASPNLTTRVCADTVSADDSPVSAIRDKPDSSVRRGIEAVKEGETSAFVSAGSTGALVAGGVMLLGRAKGVDKPCLATVLPTESGKGVLFLDLGASADARPDTLVQYAMMGDIYAKEVLGWENPRVSLLNIGTEPEKGSLNARKAHSLLSKLSLRFTGNVEARDIFFDRTDVVVTDGFTGNIFLKTCEGTAAFFMAALRKELTLGALRKAAASFLRPAFLKVREILDYSAYGGAPLLGLNGCVVKCHGPSGPEAIVNGMEQARRFIEKQVSGIISGTLSALGAEGEKAWET